MIEAQDVLAGAAALGVEKAVLVGTSRGGIISMLIGALRPGLIAGVVLNDIGPVIEGTGLARIKAYLSTRRNIRNWEEAIAAVREIGGGQFPALSTADWRAFAEAYFAEATDGSLVPQFDPNLVRALDAMSPSDKLPLLWPQFDSLARVPVLAIRGANSDLLSRETLADMAERHPAMEQLIVEGQGHAPLLRDAPTLERIAAFVRRCEDLRASL
jgi:pimeloyl-ACP methyl ester carboxylesterase